MCKVLGGGVWVVIGIFLQKLELGDPTSSWPPLLCGPGYRVWTGATILGLEVLGIREYNGDNGKQNGNYYIGFQV